MNDLQQPTNNNYRERLLIGATLISHFFFVTNEKGNLVAKTKIKEYREAVSQILESKIAQIKRKYGGDGKTVEVKAVPFKHCWNPMYDDELESIRFPSGAALVYATYVLPVIEEEWKDFDLYITAKEKK